jgi:hypothetical protein
MIEPGDMIKVTKPEPDKKIGYYWDWVDEMDHLDGKIVEVLDYEIIDTKYFPVVDGDFVLDPAWYEPANAATVSVRIAVAIDTEGQWSAYGSEDCPDSHAVDTAIECMPEGDARYHIVWVTAEVPLPPTIEVKGEIDA